MFVRMRHTNPGLVHRLRRLLGTGMVEIQSQRFRKAEWAEFDDGRGSKLPKTTTNDKQLKEVLSSLET